MTRYIFRRLIGVVAILVVISILTFGIFFLIPSDPALKSCGKGCNPERLAEIRQKLQLDLPVFPISKSGVHLNPNDSQYGIFVKGIFVGRDFVGGGSDKRCDAPCLGFSFLTDQPVWTDLIDRVPVTLSIAVGAATMWLVFGVSIGIVSALKRGTMFDRAAMSVALAGVSLPVYFTGLLVLTVLCFRNQIFALPAYHDFTDNPFLWAKGLFLPWVVLAFLFAALYARLTRATMLETMGEDYIRTARAKGLRENRVIGKHGLRAALTPIITIFGLDLGGLLGGAILTEKLFNLPGLGAYAIDGIGTQDLPKILGATLFAAFFIVMANLIVDILYAFVDPKVSYS
jgi:peptide/nickel transport system permease protein